MEAVERFEQEASSFRPAKAIMNIRHFGKKRFQEQFLKMVERVESLLSLSVGI